MIEELNSNNLSISLITLISLIVNAVTIYHWVSQNKQIKNLNKQSFHLLLGLAHSANKRSTMIVQRINSLKEQGRTSEESMIFLENMWADTRATADNLLAAAKALAPEKSDPLPYDSDDLMAVAATQARKNDPRKNA